jgi:hypothetical protein
MAELKIEVSVLDLFFLILIDNIWLTDIEVNKIGTVTPSQVRKRNITKLNCLKQMKGLTTKCLLPSYSIL